MISLLLLLLTFFTIPQNIFAIYDPSTVPNNKFGIHIADTNDIADTSLLVNSTGGDWGYVTMVASDSDRDSTKWQEIFNKMRRLHLIPIIRLATHTQGPLWTKPQEKQFDEVVSFLNKLNWPVENRYVILFNEPNHANEWGGTINPEEYADLSVALAKKLKEASSDFFILPAGLDVSAATDNESLDAYAFLQRMVKEKPEILDLMDGWTSHSYPNPGFSGSPYARGRGTLRSFVWELNVLASLGLKKNLPVFITETGWIHSQGRYFNRNLLSPEAVGGNLQIAASGVWTDPTVVAVTPFVFSYPAEPFDHFSWKQLESNDYYAQYYRYQAITKQKGQPKQHEVYTFTNPLIPNTLVAGSTYTLTSEVTNNGQGILDANDGYLLKIDFPRKDFTVLADPVPHLEPGEKGQVAIHVKTPNAPGTYQTTLKLTHWGAETTLDKKEVTLVPPPTLALTGSLGWRKTSNANDVSLLVYTKDNTLIEKFAGLTLKNGKTEAPGLSDIVPGEKYRVVMIVPYYLPRQEILVLNKDETQVKFKRFLPFDVNGDGTFSFSDIIELIKSKPNTILSRLFGP